MSSPRDALNELKWREHALERAIIRYTHRGAVGDERAARGADVLAIGASFLELRSRGSQPVMIPYHRVRSIEVDGVAVWTRPAPEHTGWSRVDHA